MGKEGQKGERGIARANSVSAVGPSFVVAHLVVASQQKPCTFLALFQLPFLEGSVFF